MRSRAMLHLLPKNARNLSATLIYKLEFYCCNFLRLNFVPKYTPRKHLLPEFVTIILSFLSFSYFWRVSSLGGIPDILFLYLLRNYLSGNMKELFFAAQCFGHARCKQSVNFNSIDSSVNCDERWQEKYTMLYFIVKRPCE